MRFRPHHFLCMLTHVGKGYSQEFTDNFARIIASLNDGSCTVELVDGPDDICAPRLCGESDTTCHCHDAALMETDRLALIDLQKIPDFRGVATGSSVAVTKNLIATLRAAYKSHSIRTACKGCEWFDLCTGIADGNFKEAKLK